MVMIKSFTSNLIETLTVKLNAYPIVFKYFATYMPHPFITRA